LAEDNVPGISAAVQAGGEKPDKGLDITLAYNNNQIRQQSFTVKI